MLHLKGLTLTFIVLNFIASVQPRFSEPRKSVFCSNAPSGRQSIKCEENEVIVIFSILEGNFPESRPCDETSVPAWAASSNRRGCMTFIGQGLVTRYCNISRSCVLDPTRFENKVLHDCPAGISPNFIYVQYQCYKFFKGSAVRFGEDRQVVGGTRIDLLNPNFPCPSPDSEIDISCRIQQRNRRSNAVTEVQIKVQFLTFSITPEECDERIELEDGEQPIQFDEDEKEICSETDEVTELTGIASRTIKLENSEHSAGSPTPGSFYLRYSKEDHPGGKFWIQLRADDDIIVTCENLPRDVLGSPQKECKLPQSNDDPLDVSPNGPLNVSPNGPLDVSPNGPLDVSPNGPLDNSPNGPLDGSPNGPFDNGDEPSSHSADPDKSSGDTVPVIVGSLAGVLLFVLLLILAVIFLKRSFRKTTEVVTTEELTPSAPAYESIRDQGPRSGAKPASTPSAPAYESIRDQGPRSGENPASTGRQLHSYDNVAVEGVVGEESYTMVRKKNQAAVRKRSEEETIMVENDGVYTISGDVIRDAAGIDDVTADNDDVIMCENNDLYESTDEIEEAGKEKEEDDDDQTIMYENKELYTGCEGMERVNNESGDYEKLGGNREHSEGNNNVYDALDHGNK